MFFLALLLSFTGYAVQGTLMAKYAREMDPLSTVVYRSSTLIFTMLPLLFFATKTEIVGITEYWKEISLAGITAVVGSALNFYAFKFLPAGIKTVFSRTFGAIWAVILGIWLFGESINVIQVVIMTCIVIASIMLGRQKNDFEHLDNNATKGIIITLFNQILVGISFYYVAYVSRELSPFVAGYFWEMLIGIFSLIVVFFRPFFGGAKLYKISLREFGKIAGICSLTLLGTGGFLYAVKIGPYGIANIMMNGGIFVSILVAHFAFKEKLIKKQWIWIFALVAGIVALNFVK